MFSSQSPKRPLPIALRNPVNGIVVADQVILYCCHLDEPGLSCIVDQRCITSPAVWIAHAQTSEHRTEALFRPDPLIPSGSAFFTNIPANGVSAVRSPFAIYKLYKWKVIFTSYIGIVFTKCRSDMNDTGTICQWLHSYHIRR